MGQRTLVVTGGSDGIGAEAARQVTATRATDQIILVGRSEQKTAAVAESIGAEHFTADYSRLAEVRHLAADIRASTDRIDVLANNAGGAFGERVTTEDGNERTFPRSTSGR